MSSSRQMQKPKPRTVPARRYSRMAPSRFDVIRNFAFNMVLYSFAMPTLVFAYFAISFLLIVLVVPVGVVVWYMFPEERPDYVDAFLDYFQYYFGSWTGPQSNQRHPRLPYHGENVEQRERKPMALPRNPYRIPAPEVYINNRNIANGDRDQGPALKEPVDKPMFEIYSECSPLTKITPPSPQQDMAHVRKENRVDAARGDNDGHQPPQENKVLSDGLPYDLRNIPISPHWALKTPKSQMSQASSLTTSRLNSTTSSPWTRKSTIRYPSPASNTPGTVVRRVLIPEGWKVIGPQAPLGELPVEYNASLGSHRTQSLLKNNRQLVYDQLKLTNADKKESVSSPYAASNNSTTGSGSPSKKVRFAEKEGDSFEAERVAEQMEEIQIATETANILFAMSEGEGSGFSTPETENVLGKYMMLHENVGAPLNSSLGKNSISHSNSTIGRAGGKAIIHEVSKAKKSQGENIPIHPQSSPTANRHLQCFSPVSSKLNIAGINSNFSSPSSITKLKLQSKPAKSTSLRTVSVDSTSSVTTVVAASEASVD